MPSLASLDPIGKIGRYDLIGRLAAGGMAEIFLAREAGPRTVGRHLVVKRILPHIADDPRMVEMFVHEAELCMNLRHPHICAIHEFGETAGSFYLAMEWVRGVSLREFIEKVEQPLPIPLVTKIFADIAAALHHAHTCCDQEGHALSIVHRDVNPENIMIGFDGVAKLLDFGVAKANSQRSKTEAGVLKGKFAYISPEQYQGEPLDGRSDVFSLGVSIFEALTGSALYDRASEYETVAAIVLDPLVPSIREIRPDVPAELDAIIRRAMAKDRNERYASADELQAALVDFAANWGKSMRHADVSEAVGALVPGLATAQPSLDRRPPTLTGAWPASEARPVDSPSAEMDLLLLGAEADEELESLYLRQRRSKWRLPLVAGLVILGSMAVVAWVVLKPRPGEAGSSAAGTEITSAAGTDITSAAGTDITSPADTAIEEEASGAGDEQAEGGEDEEAAPTPGVDEAADEEPQAP